MCSCSKAKDREVATNYYKTLCLNNDKKDHKNKNIDTIKKKIDNRSVLSKGSAKSESLASALDAEKMLLEQMN